MILTEPVKGNTLRSAAEKAFRRFPYFARKVSVNKEGAYVFESCTKPITVTPDDHIVRLGTEETNGLLFAITYKGSNIYFSFAHNFCGACGMMRWLKATLWQYLTDMGHEVDSISIMTTDTPMTPEECAEPDVPSLPTDQPVGNLVFPKDAFAPMLDYMEYMRDPNRVNGYYPIIIPKKELMQYARDNDGSPNSIISALLFKMSASVFPGETKFAAKIACNYRADVGCPETYRDMVRQLYIPYDIRMKDWPIEKLSTMTRSRMYIQMQPEASWNECRMVKAFRQAIDVQPDLYSKANYAFEHSPTIHGTPSTYFISYVGKVEWGGLAPFIQAVFTLTLGNIMIEINATEEAFCLSFQTVRKDRKYLDVFLKTLDEEGIAYKVGGVEERKLPEIVLPD